jgi:hypothetical protein
MEAGDYVQSPVSTSQNTRIVLTSQWLYTEPQELDPVLAWACYRHAYQTRAAREVSFPEESEEEHNELISVDPR